MSVVQKVLLTKTTGATMSTAKKYCERDINVVPRLSPLKVTANGTYPVPDGFAGNGDVTVEVPLKEEIDLQVVENNKVYAAPSGQTYKSVAVAVPVKEETTLTITKNGKYDAPEGQVYKSITAVVEPKEELELTITENGTYTAPEGQVFNTIIVNVPTGGGGGGGEDPDPGEQYDFDISVGGDFSIDYNTSSGQSSPIISYPIDCLECQDDGGTFAFTGKAPGTGTIYIYAGDGETISESYTVRVTA